MKTNITIGIPVYNQKIEYLKECLHSIVKQSTTPHEVLILDDGSENSYEVQRLTEEYETKYIYQENQGIGSARNAIAKNATGTYLAYLSSDDAYAKNFLEECIPFLDENTATYVDVTYTNESGISTNIFKAPEATKENVIKWALQKNMFINFSGVILPRQIFSRVQFVNELRKGEDLIFLLDTIVAELEWRHVAKPLLFYRVHEGMGTNQYVFSDWVKLWGYLVERLERLGVDDKTIKKAYVKSYKKTYPMCLTKEIKNIGRMLGLAKVKRRLKK